MKLAIIGGGGIRTPMLVDSLFQRQMVQLGQKIISRLTLMDVQADRLAVVLSMSKFLRDRLGSDVLLEATTDLRAALEDADFIITTMRVGFEPGRVIDERVALDNGVIGQETVGAGGFAMAMRSIPEVLKVAEIAKEVAPKAWLINFTNPAGIIAQALHDMGYDRVVGICDSADSLHRRVASIIGTPADEMKSRVFGLNHCSLTTKVLQNGDDVTARVQSSRNVQKNLLGIFNAKDVLALGGLPNEYLYYYLYPKKAYEDIISEPKSRGESIVEMNQKFFTLATRPKYHKDPGAVLALHKRILHARHSSYMNYAWEDTEIGNRPDYEEEEGGEGYAGVALDFIEAVTSNKSVDLVLNVPAGKPIAGMGAHEVVETSCKVSRKAIQPILPKEVPDNFARLIRRLKSYETLTTQAVRQKSKKLALWALEANPLVKSAAKGSKILKGYTELHGGIFEELE